MILQEIAENTRKRLEKIKEEVPLKEVQAKAQARLKRLLACRDGKDDWDPYAYIKWLC